MNSIRTKATPLVALSKVTTAEHEHLRASGLASKNYWTNPGPGDMPVLTRFKSEIKRYYYLQQTRLCCYCSSELQMNQNSYDAEHIIDKSGAPEYMFELSNLAAACKMCNTNKGTKPVLAIAGPFHAIPALSVDYLIVHPHLDEWGDHLTYDAIGRIVEAGGSAKGRHTIKICGIDDLNAMRLSDAFTPQGNGDAEKTLRSLFRLKSSAWKKKRISFLEDLAAKLHSSRAKAIVDALKREYH